MRSSWHRAGKRSAARSVGYSYGIDMSHHTSRPRRSRVAQILSTILFVAAIAFAGTAIYLWYTEDEDEGPGPPPTAVTGEAELANVLAVLQDANENWDYGRTSARTDQIDPPCQLLKLGDVNLCAFFFGGESPEQRIDDREQAAGTLDLESMVIATTSGRVLSEGKTLHMAQASNVITILMGGDDELANQVADSLANLP